MWNDLTMQQRADVISMAVKAGMRDIKSIRSFYDETLGSRRFEDGGSTKDSTPGMTGMMKAALATAAHFGNPTARRMTNYDTRSYVWPDEYEEDGIFMEPKKGNVYVASYDNLVTPRIQDTGNGLTFVNNVWSPENEQRSYSQSLKFNNEEDARYFGEHYKEIAPMMRLYTGGGTTVSRDPYYVNIKKYPVVNAEDEGLSEYFMNHKDVAGMAIGGGANGIDGPRRIVMNPYSDVLKTDLQKEGLVRIEALRHIMDENNYRPPFELSEHQKNLQKTIFKDMPYGSNDEAFKQSIISRILVGDAEDLQPTPEQEAEAARFIFSNDSTTANQKAFGGHLLGGGGATDAATEFAIGMVPVIGAGYDIYQAYEDPSLSNILIAGSSTILDAANLLSGGTASLPVAAAKGFIKGGIKKAVKEAVVKHAVPTIERSLAGTGRVTHSMHRQAVRTANQNAKKILTRDLKEDARQQALFTFGQGLFQTKDGKFIWQK